MLILEQRKVQTIIGNGQQGNDFVGGMSPLQQAISSPWDLGKKIISCIIND